MVYQRFNLTCKLLKMFINAHAYRISLFHFITFGSQVGKGFLNCPVFQDAYTMLDIDEHVVIHIYKLNM